MQAEEFVLSVVSALPSHQVVGKKRLQKLCYLLQSAGAPLESSFALKNFGPFSSEIDSAAIMLALFGELAEEERETGPNGYMTTVYSLPSDSSVGSRLDPKYVDLVQKLDGYTTLELEMASTVLYFIEAGSSPEEAISRTREMKPSKSSDRIFSKSKQVLELLD